MKNKTSTLLAVFGAVIGTLSSAQATIFTYANGNLILGFQATAGDGSQKNVFFDLGSATGFRDNGNQGSLGNINATLTAAYGSDWYTREDVYFGVIANLNANPTSGFGSTGPVNGDPSRTFYLSAPATTPGTGALIAANAYPPASLGTGGTSLSGLENVLTPNDESTGWIPGDPNPLANGLQKLGDGAAILDQLVAEHTTAWNNGWTIKNPTPGAAFSVFTGGIQQNFGKGGSATYVDVQRVLATNTGAIPTGVVGGGTYETTISISSTGAITSLTSSPASAFTTWIDTTPVPALVNASDKLANADPDRDGILNIMEFVLNGNAAASDPSILPTLNASGANFAFSFNRRDDSEAEAAVTFQYGSDLIGWTDVAVGPASAGSVVVNENGAALDTITVTIPKGVNPRIFGRLKAVK